MTETKQSYLEHIYDEERIDLARTLIEKESRKLFHGLPEEAWHAIHQSIHGWAENPTEYQLEDSGLSDFWDSFAAFMESIKLKSNFIAWITAENVQWQKIDFPIRNIQMTSFLGQLKKVPDLDLRNDLPFAVISDVLAAHPDAIEEQKRLIDMHSTDPIQDTYPIIIREAGEGLFKVLDGNRRTLKALLNNQVEIEAWVGKIDGVKPINFWVPLNDMFQLVKVFDNATENGDEQLQQSVVHVLKAHFKLSTVAEQSYRNRIGNQHETAKRLFDLTQLI